MMQSPLIMLYRLYFGICRFRRQPQDVPYSRELFGLTLAGYMLACVALNLVSYPLQPALTAGVVEGILLVAVTWALLGLRRLPQRWLQTATALAGVGTLFTLLAIPLFLWLSAGQAAAGRGGPAAILILMLIVWNIAVMAHVLRHALSGPFALGVLLALGYVILITALVTPLLHGAS
jgi:hypothetical protein